VQLLGLFLVLYCIVIAEGLGQGNEQHQDEYRGNAIQSVTNGKGSSQRPTAKVLIHGSSLVPAWVWLVAAKVSRAILNENDNKPTSNQV